MLVKVEDLQTLEFEITSLCNAGCPGCPRTQLGPGKGFELNTISFEDLRSWLPSPDRFESLRIFKFSGNLGDPAVHPELLDIMNWLCREYHQRIAIHTNGGVRDVTWWRNLGELSSEGWARPESEGKWRLRVNWAIDGLEDTNHIYRVGVHWNRLWRNLNTYLDAGGKAEWHFIAFSHNEHQIDEAKELAHSLGMEFKLRYAARNERYDWINKKGEVVSPGKKAAHPHRDEIKKSEKIFEESHIKEDKALLKDFTETMSCHHHKEKVAFIGADQSLWPCCMLYDESIKNTDWPRQFQATLPEESGWNDLRKYSMDEIFDHHFYKTISQRWNLNSDLFTRRCVRSCGKNGKFLTKML